jgi:hypothetical protein
MVSNYRFWINPENTIITLYTLKYAKYILNLHKVAIHLTTFATSGTWMGLLG